MTSRQWAEISIAFDTPPGERQRVIAESGLCRAAGYGGFCLALQQFCGDDAYEEGLRLLPYQTPEGDLLRASLAALFAAMSADERREVLGA